MCHSVFVETCKESRMSCVYDIDPDMDVLD